jgi:hypothetical protein
MFGGEFVSPCHPSTPSSYDYVTSHNLHSNFSVAFVPVCKSNSRESRTASRPQTLGKCKGNVLQNLRKSFVVSYGS